MGCSYDKCSEARGGIDLLNGVCACVCPHDIKTLQKQVISQEDVGLKQVFIVRVYSSSNSAVCKRQEKGSFQRDFQCKIQKSWRKIVCLCSSDFNVLKATQIFNLVKKFTRKLNLSSMTSLQLSPIPTLCIISPLLTHSPEWMLMVVPTRLLFLCLFSHRKSSALRAWSCQRVKNKLL